MAKDFYGTLSEIIAKDPRYKLDAYEFVMQALWHTQKKLKREGHVSGKELSGGIRDLAIEQFGPMAKAVFTHWGIKNTSDFGEIVFNMIESGLMGKTAQDTREDFHNVYDFDQALDVFNSNAK
ncbi:MAG: hypothetical protein NT033_05550 [Candidatus Omnitrophica bacterium]|nr:hypothetical protein [Candidatus Omnitrophota bacterium]